jgi:hypothetical protein
MNKSHVFNTSNPMNVSALISTTEWPMNTTNGSSDAEYTDYDYYGDGIVTTQSVGVGVFTMLYASCGLTVHHTL